jgi:Ca2+-binding RTX toxin-like protein
LTKLFGEDGNDIFVVRAFVLKGDPTKTAGGGDAEAFGGGGDDSFLYNINAPLAIDGGAGTDTIVVLGTERADSFLITEQGIFGAGLNISFEGVEKAEIDGLEGDDTFYVQSTAANMAVTVIGGLGSDYISVAGDVMTDIVSLEVEGSSGIVNHAVNSLDPAFNGIFVDGLRLNVANENSGLFEMDTRGLAILNEGGTFGYYDIRMTQAVAATAYLTVSAARSSTQDRSLPGAVKANSALVSTSSGSGYESATVLTFTNSTTWQRVYVQAPEDGAAEGTRDVVISHQAMAAGGTPVEIADKINTTKIANTEVTVFDNDAYGIRVAGNPSSIDIAEGAAGETLTLTLSRMPDVGEDIVYEIDYPTSDYTVTSTDATFTYVDDGKLHVQFTTANYATGIDVTVTAIDDSIEENRERQRLSIALDQTDTTQASWNDLADPTEVDVRIFDNDKGEVLVTETGGDTIVSATAPDTYTLVLSKMPTADVFISVLTDGQTIATSTDTARWNNTDKTVTFNATNWDQPITIDLTIGTIVSEPQPTIDPGAQNHLVSDIQGPLFIFGGVGPGADRAVKVAKTLPTELNAELVAVTNPVDENEQTDRLVVFNDGSNAVQSGRMSEDTNTGYDNISGFDMGTTDLVLNFGTTAIPDPQTFKAGINYDEMEVVELLLGDNNDTLIIESTAPDALTVVHGGGGDDTIRVQAPAGTSGANVGGNNRTLAIFGDTTQDGLRYNSVTGALDGSGREFAAGGDDVIDVSEANGFVIVSGGVGNDRITGSNHNDHLLGGSGDDTINALGGNDHVYGDNALIIDQSVRLEKQPQLISIVTEQVGTTGYNVKTGDALSAPGADVISGSGNNVILTDFGLIEQIAGTNRAFDTASIVNIQSQREDEGGADVVNMAGGLDFVIGGQGTDDLSIGTGGGVILGDNGQIDMDPASQQLVQIATHASAFGDSDTITASDGSAFIFGGSAGDQITTAGGDDVIAGDQGTLAFVSGVRSVFEGPIEDPAYGGDDTVSTGAGDDWVILGEGNDMSTSDSGLNIVIGDAGGIEAEGTTGIYERVENTQTGTGGDDTVVGGSGRDVQLGGAGADSLTGNLGNDLLNGDNGLLTRMTPFASGQRTFESTAITDGGNDTLIGDTLDDPETGFDVMIGGIGNDTFSLSLGTDIVAGEFLRVRFVPTGGDRDLITSFLTPAVRDLDLLVQLTLGVNFSSERTVIVGSPEGTNIDIGFPGDARVSILDRMDLLFLDGGIFGAALMEGLLSEDDLSLISGLTGFRLQRIEGVLGGAGDALLDATNAAEPPSDENGTGEQGASGTGQGTAPEVQEDPALRALEAEFATARAAAAEDGTDGGWQMGGWLIGT